MKGLYQISKEQELYFLWMIHLFYYETAGINTKQTTVNAMFTVEQ